MGDEHSRPTTVEFRQLYVVRQHRNLAPEVCRQCPAPIASMIAPDDAAIITGISTREMYRWVEDGIVHFRETANGSLLVCLNSFPITVDPSQLSEP